MKPTFLIGEDTSRSLSPSFQNRAFTEKKIRSVYLAISIKREEFFNTIPSIKKLDLFGLNITYPYKIDIIDFCDSLSNEAKKIGSVNTIEIGKNGEWIGHNTDYYGVLMTLKKNSIPSNVNALVIGAGGATPAVIYALDKYGIKHISVTNRSSDKLAALEKRFDIKTIDFNHYNNKIDKFDLIINCTTLNFTNLIENFLSDRIYFDINYFFDYGVNGVITGHDMLFYQGVMAFEIWSKEKFPFSIF